ncbi:MAG: thioredoxin, partial [Octadecabacter sp.]
MIELGGGQQPAAATDLVKDVSEDTFMQDVIEASNEVPIIVDFWAAWCGPCKTLGPMLEDAVKKAGGRVKMVKVDVDQNQAIAGQLQIQSLPTVYAFFNGKPVDGFQGALPQSEVDAFVNKIADMGPEPDNGLDDA